MIERDSNKNPEGIIQEDIRMDFRAMQDAGSITAETPSPSADLPVIPESSPDAAEIGGDAPVANELLPETAAVEEVPRETGQDMALLLSHSEQIVGLLQTLQSTFDSKIRYDATKDRMIESLHKELQGYREDMAWRILRPVLNGLMMMYDDLTSIMNYSRADETPEQRASRLQHNLVSIQESIEALLEQNGVTPVREEDDLFVSQRQRVVRVEPTDDPTKDKHIYQRIRNGFRYEDKIIRPETVIVYKYVPPSIIENSPED